LEHNVDGLVAFYSDRMGNFLT